MRLKRKQENENENRGRHNKVFQTARYHREPFEGGKHGDGRGDHAVPVNERGADQTHADDKCLPLRAATSQALSAGEKRHQRHDPALTMVIDAHGDANILDRRHDNERPQNQRQAAKDDRAVRCVRASRAEHDFQRIERACADVAENDAEGW